MKKEIKKIKKIYFIEKREDVKKLLHSDMATGLIIVLEDGRTFANYSTDVVMPWEEIKK